MAPEMIKVWVIALMLTLIMVLAGQLDHWPNKLNIQNQPDINHAKGN